VIILNNLEMGLDDLLTPRSRGFVMNKEGREKDEKTEKRKHDGFAGRH
jgi:hypothetical protein